MAETRAEFEGGHDHCLLGNLAIRRNASFVFVGILIFEG
jgi:hypothetical protein